MNYNVFDCNIRYCFVRDMRKFRRSIPKKKSNRCIVRAATAACRVNNSGKRGNVARNLFTRNQKEKEREEGR